MRFKTYHESDLSEMAACRIMILNVRFFGTLWIPSFCSDMYHLLHSCSSFNISSLFQDHIQEVLNKWQSIDDEIWAKIIVLERNR